MTCPITADRDEFRGAGTCATCMWVKTFKPRKDEQTRYDFGDVGYGCGKPGYEGYTQPFSSCSFYSARAHTAAEGGECPSCHGLNTSCPDGCGRDPLTGELNGTRLHTAADAGGE